MDSSPQCYRNYTASEMEKGSGISHTKGWDVKVPQVTFATLVCTCTHTLSEPMVHHLVSVLFSSLQDLPMQSNQSDCGVFACMVSIVKSREIYTYIREIGDLSASDLT